MFGPEIHLHMACTRAWGECYTRFQSGLLTDQPGPYRYSVFRRVVDYYSDYSSDEPNSGEDAFDMRKPCSRDKKLEHVREDGENFRVSPEHVM